MGIWKSRSPPKTQSRTQQVQSRLYTSGWPELNSLTQPHPLPLAPELQRTIPRTSEERERDTQCVRRTDREMKDGHGEKDGEDLLHVR